MCRDLSAWRNGKKNRGITRATERTNEGGIRAYAKGGQEMRYLKRLKTSTKLWIITGLAIVGLTATMAASLNRLNNTFMSEKELKTRHLVETVTGIVDYYYKLSKTGKMRENDAKSAALSLIRTLRYEKD